MSLLFRTIFATACTSTHHKLALDALLQLREADAEGWRRLFLKHYQAYLKGSKAPDDQFKDFKNHVLHVSDGFWGGAVKASQDWYGRLVKALREQSWEEVAFAAGVLSHYYSDPLMPFHTGQTEEEGKVHRAAEWSVACAYDSLRALIEAGEGYPDLVIPYGADWLEVFVKQGASVAHPHYHSLVERYDLARGVKDPPAGLDAECRARVAECLAHATVGIARLLEQAFYEADARPPEVSLSLETFLAQLAVPVRWVTKKLADAEDRAIVERIYAEVRETGKAVESLPEDEKAVRKLHAKEVLGISVVELDSRSAKAAPPTPAVKPVPAAKAPRLTVVSLPERPAPAPAAVVKPIPTPAAVAPAASIPLKIVRDDPPAIRPAAPAKPVAPTATKIERPAPPVVAKTGSASLPVTAPVKAVAPPATTPVKLAAPTVERAPVNKPEPPTKSPQELRFYLNLDSPLEDAPSIGNTTAQRFASIGVRTVTELLALDPDAAARRLNFRRLDAATIRDYQAQATLCCRIPRLRGHDAQILVACDITDPAEVAASTPAALLARLEPFLDTPAAERILRGGSRPDLEEVTDWIAWARSARPLKAA